MRRGGSEEYICEHDTGKLYFDSWIIEGVNSRAMLTNMSVAPQGLFAMQEITVIVASRFMTETRSDWVAVRLFPVVGRRTVNISRRQFRLSRWLASAQQYFSKVPMGHSTECDLAMSHAMLTRNLKRFASSLQTAHQNKLLVSRATCSSKHHAISEASE